MLLSNEDHGEKEINDDDDDDNEEDGRHDILIRSLTRLLNSSTTDGHKMNRCPYCLYRFTTNDGLTKHIPDCGTHGVQHVSYPFADFSDTLKFSKIGNQMKVSF